MSADEPTLSRPESKIAPQSRRTVVQILTGFLGLLLNAVPVTLGGLFFLDPLLRASRSVGEDSIKLRVNTDAIPADGTPVAVTVIADQTDAWNKYNNVPIGSIWVRRTQSGNLAAFNSTCPHLGCSVDFRASNNDFYCPCHTSAFELDGQPKNEIPPRGMDDLDIYTATAGKRDEAGTELWVKYKEFRGGTVEKIES
ncbi:MAG: Rieske (2Fe-2S) protein [Planctomycetaceae bacterium]|jgi:Rieske Fe-S protein